MRYQLLIALPLVALGLSSSAGEKSLQDLVLDPSCLTAPIVLEGCDQRDPPKCQKARIKYRKGCEQISLGGRK